VLGITLGWGAFLAAVLWEGGFASLRAFWNPPAFVLVVGGTLGATVLSYPGERLRTLPGVLRRAFLLPDGSAVQGSGDDRPALVAILVNLAEKARREGLLSLEDDARRAPDPILAKGIRLLIDGTDENLIREILETEIGCRERRHAEGAGLLLALGGFAPTLGVIGTVAGLVFMLLDMGDPAGMGRKISSAFIATLYGVSLANLLFLPLGNKLRRRAEAEAARADLIVAGLLAIGAGDNPRLVEDKLRAFLPPDAAAGSPPWAVRGASPAK